MGRGKGGSTSHEKRTPGGIRTSSKMSQVGEIEAKHGVLGDESFGSVEQGMANAVLKARSDDVLKQIQAKQIVQQPSAGEQKKIFEGRARRWAPVVDAAVADKLKGRLKPLMGSDPGVVGVPQKGGLHEYFGAGWVNTDLNNIDALRKELGVAPYSPPDEVIDALQKQPVSQRLYALTAEGAEFEDTSVASLSELFSDFDAEKELSEAEVQRALDKFEEEADSSLIPPGLEKLSNAEKCALFFYTRSFWTDAVNSYLRKLDAASVALMKHKAEGGNTAEAEQQMSLLMTAPGFKKTRQVATLMMNGLAKLIAERQGLVGKPLMATRGAGKDKFSTIEEQDAVYDAAFLSTANTATHKSPFARDSHVNMLLFSNQGAYIAAVAGYNENEILMFPGTIFNLDMVLEPLENKQLLVLRELVNGEPIDVPPSLRKDQWDETGDRWGEDYVPAKLNKDEIQAMLEKKADEDARKKKATSPGELPEKMNYST